MRPWVHRLLFWGSLAALGAAVVLTVLRWGTLPEQLPMHYAADGSVDRWGAKGVAMLPPALGWGAFGLLSLLRGVLRAVAGEQEDARALAIAGDLLALVRALLSLTVLWAAVCILWQRPLGAWFLPAVLAALAAVILCTIVRLKRRRIAP